MGRENRQGLNRQSLLRKKKHPIHKEAVDPDIGNQLREPLPCGILNCLCALYISLLIYSLFLLSTVSSSRTGQQLRFKGSKVHLHLFH